MSVRYVEQNILTNKDVKSVRKNHKKIEKLISEKHQGFSMNLAGYQISITVEMDDGKELTFKR